jgi:glycosyltransferase involved in cell wall biosynthesis
MIMLLGRRDEPTDAVRDYANCLSEALNRKGMACKISEMGWHEQGWLGALFNLWHESRAWRGRWVLLHYTALMWSRRGFPIVAPLVLRFLKFRGCWTAIVFHDVYAVPGSRWIDRFRVSLQERIMRYLSMHACCAIITVPAEGASWLPIQKRRMHFIPVGANIPSLDELAGEGFVPVRDGIPKVAVFGIPTWPAAQKREVEAIVHSVRQAAAHAGELQLLVLGRGAKEAKDLLQAGFSGTGVRLQVDGIRSGREISTGLSYCDVLLFVRGPVSSRRGSAVAALACGLPIVAYQGRETAFPLTEAGIIFVPQDDLDSLGKELIRVLQDRELRLRLSELNRKVFREWFSWDRIAERWVEVLTNNNEEFAE